MNIAEDAFDRNWYIWAAVYSDLQLYTFLVLLTSINKIEKQPNVILAANDIFHFQILISLNKLFFSMSALPKHSVLLLSIYILHKCF